MTATDYRRVAPSDAGAQAPHVSGAAPTGENLAQSGVRGALWQGSAFVVGKAIVLLTTVLLARLLAPEQFGLVSLALVLVAYVESFSDVGVAQALVYLPAAARTLRAALLVSLATGIVLAGSFAGLAPAVAAVFGRSDVAPLVRLLSLTLFAGALCSVPEALLRRALHYSRLTIATIVRAVVTGAVSVVLAGLGAGAWAIAWGTVAGALTYGLAVWLLAPVRPDWHLWRARGADLREILGFGLPVAGATLLAKLIFDVDYLVVGHQLGATALGYYTLAFRIPEFLIINVFFVISSVTYPLYSQARSDLDRLRRGYLLSVRVQSLYGVCTGVGLATVSAPLVPLVFGADWRPAVPPLVALALYASLRSLGAGANDLYKAMGKPGVGVVVSFVRLLVLVPVLVLATRWGVTGVAWAQALCALVFVLLMQAVASRVMRSPLPNMLRAVSPSVVAGFAIALVAVPLARVPLPPEGVLALAVPAGVVAAVLVLVVGFPSVGQELRGLVRRKTATAGSPSHPSSQPRVEPGP